MLKKVIKYTDYNDNPREGTYYFNLNKVELTEMQVSTEGGLDVLLERIIEERDPKNLIKFFKAIILKSYGVKSQDGTSFTKTPELTRDFEQSEAFVELYMELASDDKAAAAFINGVFPKDWLDEVEKNGELPELLKNAKNGPALLPNNK